MSRRYAVINSKGLRPFDSVGKAPIAHGKNIRPSANGEWIIPKRVSVAAEAHHAAA